MTKFRIRHKNCNSQDISDETQSSVTKECFLNVTQKFSDARTFSDQKPFMTKIFFFFILLTQF